MSVVATLLVRVAANLTELDAAFTDISRKADRMGREWNKLGGQLQGIGGRLTKGLTLPLAAIGAAATTSFMGFETAMRGVQAAVQPTATELEQLRAAAVEWGQKTQFSATEAADALGELGKAGVKTGDSIELLPSVLNLATVGSMSLADAATLTTDTLAQFRLKVKDSAKVNDVLAAAAQASTISVKDLGDSLKYAGPVAGAFGMSIEETGAALAQFGKLGFKGEMAGTALRNVLTDIKNPTKGMRDALAELNIATLASADGSVHLTEVIRTLQKSGADGAQIMQMFGDRAGPAMVAAVRAGADELVALNTAMEGAGGTAQRVADTLMSGLGGAVERMRGALETAGIAIGSILAPALTTIADAVGEVAEWVTNTLVPAFNALPYPLQVVAGLMGTLAIAIGPVVYVAGTLASSWGSLLQVFAKTAPVAISASASTATFASTLTLQSIAAKASAIATATFSGAVAILSSPITLAVGAVVALVGGLRLLTGSWEGVLRVLTLGLVDFKTIATLWDGMKAAATQLGDAVDVMRGQFDGAVGALGSSLKPAIDAIRTSIEDVAKAVTSPLNVAIGNLGTESQKTADQGLQQLARGLADVGDRLLGGAMLQFSGQLEALRLIAVGTAQGFAAFASMLRSQLVGAIQIVSGSIDALINTYVAPLARLVGIELTGAVERATAWIKSFGISFGDAKTQAEGFRGALDALLPSFSGLKKAQDDQRQAASDAAIATAKATGNFFDLRGGVYAGTTAIDAAGLSTSAFADVLANALPKAAATATRTVKPLTDEQKKAAEAAKKAAEAFAELVAKMGGTDAAKAAEDMTKALAALAAKGIKPSAKGMEDARDVFDDFADLCKRMGKEVPPAMRKLYASVIPPPELANELTDFMRELFTRSMVPAVPMIRQAARPVQQALLDAFRIDAPQVGRNIEKDLKAAAIDAKLREWGAGLKQQAGDILAGVFSGQTGMRDAIGQAFGAVQGFAVDAMREVGSQVSIAFSAAFHDGASVDWGTLFGGKEKAKGAAVGAAVGFTVGTAFGKSFGKEVGAAMGAVSGAAAGAVVGGWVGAGVGAAVGFVSGLMAGIEQEKQLRRAMEQARVDLLSSVGTMEKLREITRSTGVDFNQLWNTQNPEHFNAILQRMQAILAKNKADVEDMAKGLDATTKAGALLSKVDLSNLALQSGRLPDLPKMLANRGAKPGSEEAIFAFIGQQQEAALKGIDTFLSNATIKTKAGAAAISASLAGLYQTLLEGGATPTQAFAQMEPTIEKLRAQLAATGFAGDAAFGPLGALARMANDEIGGPLMDAMAGLEQGLTSTANLGLLNQDSFHGFAQEVLAGFKGMEALGQGGEVALAGARGSIQKLWELSQDFGYSLSEDEQAMVDFALASGTVGEKFRPAADRMANAIDALVDRMDQFLLKFSEIAPAADEGAKAITDTLGRVRIPPVDFPIRPKYDPDEFPGGGTYIPAVGPSIAALASGGVVRRPTVALIGEKGPEAVVPLSDTFATQTDMTIMLDSEVLTRAVLRKQPRVLRAYGAVR